MRLIFVSVAFLCFHASYLGACDLPPFTCLTFEGMTCIYMDGQWLKVPTTPGIGETSFGLELHEKAQEHFLMECSIAQGRKDYEQKARGLAQKYLSNPVSEESIFGATASKASPEKVIKKTDISKFEHEKEIEDEQEAVNIVLKELPKVVITTVKLRFATARALNKFADGLYGAHEQEHLDITYLKREGIATDKALEKLIRAVSSSTKLKIFELTVEKVDLPIVTSMIQALKISKLKTVSLKGLGMGDAEVWMFANFLNDLQARREVTIKLSIPNTADAGGLRLLSSMKAPPFYDHKDGIITLSNVPLHVENKQVHRKSKGKKNIFNK